MKKIGFLSALVASAAALLLGACNDDNDAPKPPVDLPTEVTVGDRTLELKSFYAMYFRRLQHDLPLCDARGRDSSARRCCRPKRRSA